MKTTLSLRDFAEASSAARLAGLRHRRLRWLLGVLLTLAVSASAQAAESGLSARESAAIGKKGSWSVGVFNPVEYSLSDTMAIRAYPFPVLRPASVDLRVSHLTGSWSVTGEYGLGLPGLGYFGALPLGVKGDLLPSCKVTAHDSSQASMCQAPDFGLILKAGAVASMGETDVLTARLDLAVGVPFGEAPQPLDAWPNLDLAWAAATHGFVTRLGGRYDKQLSASIRWASELNLFMVKPEDEGASARARSPLTASLWTGVDIGVGASSRFTIGVIYFNSDQRRTEMVDQGGYSTREPVRSHDIFPTIDFIWAG